MAEILLVIYVIVVGDVHEAGETPHDNNNKKKKIKDYDFYLKLGRFGSML